MKEDRGKFVEISHLKYQRQLKNTSLIYIVIFIVISINNFMIFLVIDSIIRFIFLSGVIIFIFFILLYINSLFPEPILLYKNGLMFHRTNLFLRMMEKQSITRFEDIEKIEYLDNKNGWIRLFILMKTNKKLYQAIDYKRDFDLIVTTFNNYKSKSKS